MDENGARLRWVSFDVPGFHQLPAPLYRLPSPWEQKDAVSAVAQLGGRVMRSGPLSVRRQTDLASIKRNCEVPCILSFGTLVLPAVKEKELTDPTTTSKFEFQNSKCNRHV